MVDKKFIWLNIQLNARALWSIVECIRQLVVRQIVRRTRSPILINVRREEPVSRPPPTLELGAERY